MFQFQDNLENHYKKILLNTNTVIDLLDDFLMKKGICSKIKNFFFNDCFGTMDQYKTELLIKFHVEEMNIKTSCNFTLNW